MGTAVTIPKYEAVADRVQAMIDNGVYEPGERLPSIRELHLQLGVSAIGSLRPPGPAYLSRCRYPHGRRRL
ncbi:MAG: GntR family transcriptional regulator [Spirochaetes bacterium]|jgi:DNA-binding transcriptional regulator YhcF (GntR family)|nr:GntR family transcriptional regulator [Spirochaetota bacterium]